MRGASSVTVFPGVTNEAEVRLLGVGDLTVTVVNGDGSPAPDAMVKVTKGSFPRDEFDLAPDGDGVVFLGSVFEGSYSVSATLVTATTTIMGRSSVSVPRDGSAQVTVRLEATGTVRGRFVEVDGETPIAGAQVVANGGFAFASTGINGEFEFNGLPLRSYRIVATDPVNGRLATANTLLNNNGDERDLLLVVRPVGEIRGNVLNATRTGFVPGAVVTLTNTEGLVTARTATAGPDGSFVFPGVIDGGFRLSVRDPVTKSRGAVSGTLLPGQPELIVDVGLSPRASFQVTVLDPGGEPVAGARVILDGAGFDSQADTAGDGTAAFSDVPLGSFTVTATEPAPRERSVGRAAVSLNSPGENSDVTVNVLGIGQVVGTVVGSDGVTPIEGATVEIRSRSPYLSDDSRTVTSGADGGFVFDGVSVGDYQVKASSVALAASDAGAIDADDEVDSVTLTLSESGTVRGRLVRADGVAPVVGAVVGVFFDAPSGALGVAEDITDDQGGFEMLQVPVGAVALEALVPDLNGIARAAGSLVGNGDLLDFGDVILDEENPVVEAVDPSDTAVDVSVEDDVIITFSEAIARDSFDIGGIFLCNNGEMVPAEIAVEEDGSGVERVVRINPDQPLESETLYDIVVLDGDRLGAGGGGVVARGPRDLVDRPLLVPFQSTFTTEDARPPELLSLTPGDGFVNVDVRSVVRLSFDEAIDTDLVAISLAGASGEVSGNVSVGIDGKVAVFTPDAFLPPNATFTATASGFQDAAGNVVEGQPFTATFGTLDTLGPEIAELRIKGGAAPVSNSTVEVEAVLSVPEPDARVRMTVDLQALGETTDPGDLDLPLTLPESGTVLVRANAIDVFGNEGSLAEFSITVQGNQPPQIQLVRLNPPDGAVGTGEAFSFRVEATDDSGVTELRGAMAGAATAPLQTSDGSPLNFFGVVAETAGPDDVITVFAEATDNSGLVSDEVQFTIPIFDATPPTVAIVSPDAGGTFLQNDDFPLRVAAADNFAVTQIDVAVSGAFAFTDNLIIDDPTSNDLEVDFPFPIPADVPEDGAAFTVTITAFDAAGHQITVQREYAMRDLTPPVVTFSSPANGSNGRAVINFGAVLEGTDVVVRYSEEIAEASLVPGSVTMEDSTGADVPGSVGRRGFGGVSDNVSFTPDNPLRFDETYSVHFSSLLTDEAGNGATARTIVFTTSNFRITQPVSGSQVVEGQTIPVRAEGTSNVLIQTVRINGPGGNLASIPRPGSVFNNVAGFDGEMVVPLIEDFGGPPFALSAEAIYFMNGGGTYPPVALNPVTLDIRSRDEDSDGDGIFNGDEIDTGLDPFFDDAGDDPDGDTLTNAQEVALGTDPFREDSDGDGIRDDVDPEPLVPLGGAAPNAGILASRLQYLHFDGVDDRIEGPRGIGSFGDAVTVEGWIRTTQVIPEDSAAMVITKWRGNERYAFAVLVDDSGGLRFQAGDNFGPSVFVQGTTPVNDGEWHHFACVREGNTSMRIFIDGLEDAVLTDFELNLAFDLGNSSALFFGNWNNSLFYEGDLDELRLWERVRTRDEIRQDARRKLTGLEPGLAAYWKFDGGPGARRLLDHTIKTNDGLLGFSGGASFQSHHFPSWRADDKEFFVPPAFCVDEGAAGAISLPGSDPDGDALTATVTSLPLNGKIFQTADGATKGVKITAVPTVLSDPQNRLIYEPNVGFFGPDAIRYFVRDTSESSAEVEAAINVVPANQAPVAVNDAPPVFQDVTNVLDLAGNDTDADGDLPRVVFVSQPSNGTVAINEDGTVDLIPDTGFTGADSFTYVVADAEAWNRLQDRQSGPVNLSFVGNPTADVFGFPVWEYLYVTGRGGIGDGSPWYRLGGAKAVWDNSWDPGGFGVWTGANNGFPRYFQGSVEASPGRPDTTPLMHWICPFDSYSIDILGQLRLRWFGIGNATNPEIDVVVAKLDVSTGTIEDLLAQTVVKPTLDGTDEEAFIPVELRDVVFDKGDRLIVAHRGRTNFGGFTYLGDENLWIIPSSATNTATVSFEVRTNARPAVTAAAPGNGLRFDGNDDVTIGNVPAMQVTGDQTIEMWLKPADFNERRNPWAKAYAGEGTLTQELNGTINYFYGVVGNNSGSRGTAYDSINSVARLPLGEWTHVAVVRDLTNGLLRWYFNGVLTNEAEALFDTAVAGTLPAFIGRGYVRNYTGEIDEVRIWNVARSQAEIQSTLNQRLAGSEVGLAGYWAFEEGSGSNTADRSPNGNGGTLGSGAAMPHWVESFAPFSDVTETAEDTDVTLVLDGTDDDGDTLTAAVTKLPEKRVPFPDERRRHAW